MSWKVLILPITVISFWGCGSNTKKSQFSLIKNSGIEFENKVNSSKDFNILTYRNFYNGGGVGIADLNNDGLSDVFLTANQSANKLFLNKGNFKFEDISKSAGFTDSSSWNTGVSIVDINNDGWLDVYVCAAGYVNGKAPKSKLYINNKNLTFSDSAEKYGLTNEGGYATHAAFFDYDKDNDLDCFIINNSFIPTNTLNYQNKRELKASDWPVADFLKGGGDRFLRNDNGKFTDITQKAGVHGSLISFGLGVTVGDINNDGWSDVYVSNDFFERDYLYINQKNGTFVDEYTKYIDHSSHASMGADMADINNDGLQDLFTTEMLASDEKRLKQNTVFENYDVYKLKHKNGFGYQFMQNALQLNNAHGKFSEIAFHSKVAASDWSWGALMFDANNDSKSDIFVSNGIYKDVIDQDFIDFFANEAIQKAAMTGKKQEVEEILSKMPSNPIPNMMFVQGDNLQFKDLAKEWNLATPSFSNGSAYGDLDNDGDLDLVVNNVNMPSFVYQNNSDTTQNAYISVQLTGDSTNLFSVGAKVQLFTKDGVQTREQIPTRGFQSSVDYKLIFGLGANKNIDSVKVIWPDNTQTVLTNVNANTNLKISKNNTKPFYQSQPVLFDYKLDSTKFELPAEDDYVDYYEERNLPYMLSKEGPAACVGDVNSDGLDDVFIGAPTGSSANLYVQTKDGKFNKTNKELFAKEIYYEDVCAEFFDADGDNDLDLVVGSGGNHLPLGNENYNTRIYINDGLGNFSKLTNLPKFETNAAKVLTADFDGDNDKDIFVAARSTASSYGETPKSQLWINDGKANFTNKIVDLLGAEKLGMITDVKWLSSEKTLCIVGEWMQPLIYKFSNGKFNKQKPAAENLNGFWQSITVADIDGDNDNDLILGNVGSNSYLSTNNDRNLKLWINDFDKNGTKDKVITRMINGNYTPVFMKKDLVEQMPVLRKENLQNQAYSTKTIDQLFKKELLNQSETHEVQTTQSVVLKNENNNYVLSNVALPWQAQISCINNGVFINNANTKAVLFACNKFDFLPQFGRLDAASNILLKLDKSNQVVIQPYIFSGNTRQILKLNVAGKPKLLFILNNAKPLLADEP